MRKTLDFKRLFVMLLLCVAIAFSCCFVACSNKKDDSGENNGPTIETPDDGDGNSSGSGSGSGSGSSDNSGSDLDVDREEFSGFEVCSKIDEYGLITYNILTIDLSEYSVSGSLVSASTTDYKGNTVNLDSAEKSGNTVRILGRDFKSKVYGEKEIVLEFTDKTVKPKVNIITKLIKRAYDLVRIQQYGDLETETRNYQLNGQSKSYTWFGYHGYFMLDNNIMLNDTDVPAEKPYSGLTDKHLAYPKADNLHPTYGVANKEQFNLEHVKTMGFDGIFDGNGYTVYNAVLSEKVSSGISWAGSGFSSSAGYAGCTGLFGNVSENGVVKNLAVRASLSCKAYCFVLAAGFCGQLTNCYFHIGVNGSAMDRADISQNTNQSAVPLAFNTAYARMTDVLIRLSVKNFDDSNYTNIAPISNYALAKTSEGEDISSSVTQFTNVHVMTDLMKMPFDKISVNGGAMPDESLNQLTLHDIDYSYELVDFAPSDVKFWTEYSVEIPAFKSFIEANRNIIDPDDDNV